MASRELRVVLVVIRSPSLGSREALGDGRVEGDGLLPFGAGFVGFALAGEDDAQTGVALADLGGERDRAAEQVLGGGQVALVEAQRAEESERAGVLRPALEEGEQVLLDGGFAAELDQQAGGGERGVAAGVEQLRAARLDLARQEPAPAGVQALLEGVAAAGAQRWQPG